LSKKRLKIRLDKIRKKVRKNKEKMKEKREKKEGHYGHFTLLSTLHS
jgi:CRISPR/Cas system-associated protein Cas7 (RAMP superfamily)